MIVVSESMQAPSGKLLKKYFLSGWKKKFSVHYKLKGVNKGHSGSTTYKITYFFGGFPKHQRIKTEFYYANRVKNKFALSRAC